MEVGPKGHADIDRWCKRVDRIIPPETAEERAKREALHRARQERKKAS